MKSASTVTMFLKICVFVLGIVACNGQDPCEEKFHQLLTDDFRDVGHTCLSSLTSGHCDQSLPEDWYAFKIRGEYAEIPTNVCIMPGACGTQLPMRLLVEGAMPGPGEEKEAVGCTAYSILSAWDCCVLRSDVTIRNCGAFYVYKLQPPDRCPVSFCALVTGTQIDSSKTAQQSETVQEESCPLTPPPPPTRETTAATHPNTTTAPAVTSAAPSTTFPTPATATSGSSPEPESAATTTTPDAAAATTSDSATGTTSDSATGTTPDSANGTTSDSATGTTSDSTTSTAPDSDGATTVDSAEGTTSVPATGTTSVPATGTTSVSATRTTSASAEGTTSVPATGNTSVSATGTTSVSATDAPTASTTSSDSAPSSTASTSGTSTISDSDTSSASSARSALDSDTTAPGGEQTFTSSDVTTEVVRTLFTSSVSDDTASANMTTPSDVTPERTMSPASTASSTSDASPQTTAPKSEGETSSSPSPGSPTSSSSPVTSAANVSGTDEVLISTVSTPTSTSPVDVTSSADSGILPQGETTTTTLTPTTLTSDHTSSQISGVTNASTAASTTASTPSSTPASPSSSSASSISTSTSTPAPTPAPTPARTPAPTTTTRPLPPENRLQLVFDVLGKTLTIDNFQSELQAAFNQMLQNAELQPEDWPQPWDYPESRAFNSTYTPQDLVFATLTVNHQGVFVPARRLKTFLDNGDARAFLAKQMELPLVGYCVMGEPCSFYRRPEAASSSLFERNLPLFAVLIVLAIIIILVLVFGLLYYRYRYQSGIWVNNDVEARAAVANGGGKGPSSVESPLSDEEITRDEAANVQGEAAVTANGAMGADVDNAVVPYPETDDVASADVAAPEKMEDTKL